MHPSTAAGRPDASTDEARLLAARVSDALAVRAVKRLQHAWSHYAEAGDLAAMTALFSRGGRLILPPREATGAAEIHALLVSVMGHGQAKYPADRLNVPLLLSPVVTVAPDGRTARGRWHEIAMTGRFGKRASWAGGIHENEYVLEDGVWKLAVVCIVPQFAGPHSTGWRNVSPDVPLVPFHFSPDTAGTPSAPDLAARLAAADDGTADPAALAAGAAAAVAESEVLNLLAAYGHYLDRRLWDDVADLFAEDGELRYADEPWRGRVGIRIGLESLGPAGLRHGELFDHLQAVPVVTVAPDGRSAESRGIELQMLGRHGEHARWGVRIGEGRFEQRDGRWRITGLRFSPRLLADHANGWDRDLPPQPASATAYPTHRGPAIRFPHPVLEPAPTAAPAPDADLATVRRLLRVAEGFDGAENVACAYGYFLDEAHWDESADIFAEDGWKELSFIGTYIGRKRIRDSLIARYGRRPRRPDFLPIHQKTQPYVTVLDDGRAHIRLKMLQINSSWDAEGSLVTGVYEEQVVREAGVWRIHGMDLEYILVASWADAWARIEPGLARRFAPDDAAIAAFDPAPDGPLRGLAFAPFPEIGPLGFHYANPCSGREPAIRFGWSDGRFPAAG